MQNYQVKQIKDSELKSSICRNIIESLPEWFGIKKAREKYIKEVKKLPFFAVYVNKKPIGFIAIKIHYEKSAELYVLALLKEYQGKGIGTKLLKEAENYLKKKGVLLLQVKTLAESVSYEPYDKTRLFYTKLGFIELETIDKIWGKKNPCLIMVKCIEK